MGEDWIERAEAALETRLSPSYRWWLRHFGGGEILGEEIYSIMLHTWAPNGKCHGVPSGRWTTVSLRGGRSRSTAVGRRRTGSCRLEATLQTKATAVSPEQRRRR